MLKKFFIAFTFILSAVTLQAAGEEYVFTTTCDFPVTYSSSIEVVNARHNLYTTENFSDIEHLIDAGIVTLAEPMSYSTLFEYTASDPAYPLQTNLTQVSAPFAWNKNVFGEGVKIAVIDSGLISVNFDKANITLAHDYTETAASTLSYCRDEIGHGTKVAGIISAEHDQFAIAGIAPKAHLYIFKCFYRTASGETSGKNSDIADAIFRAIDDYDCDIINISAGTPNATVLIDAIEYAKSKDVLIVSAVGNDGAVSSKYYYPAAYDSTIGVGSVDSNGVRASHSQRNDSVNIMAPGVDIYSLKINSDTLYETGKGTSFATPHVTAAAALAKSLNPNLSSSDIASALYTTCDSMGTQRFSGHGILNIQALLTYTKATLEKGSIISSQNGKKSYKYLLAPSGYVTYFAKYKNNIMESVTTDPVNITDDFSCYLWQKNTLAPYTDKITEINY